MDNFLLQDWITLRMAGTVPSITQSEPNWLSCEAFQDVVFFLEVQDIVVGGTATALQMNYETAPTKDETLFAPMATAISLNPASPPTRTIVTPILLAQNPDVPLARWVRWRLQPDLLPGAPWAATFRIHCAVNARGVR